MYLPMPATLPVAARVLLILPTPLPGRGAETIHGVLRGWPARSGHEMHAEAAA
jgi:hypothetical protein